MLSFVCAWQEKNLYTNVKSRFTNCQRNWSYPRFFSMKPDQKFFLIEKLRSYIQKLDAYIAQTQETLQSMEDNPNEPSDRR